MLVYLYPLPTPVQTRFLFYLESQRQNGFKWLWTKSRLLESIRTFNVHKYQNSKQLESKKSKNENMEAGLFWNNKSVQHWYIFHNTPLNVHLKLWRSQVGSLKGVWTCWLQKAITAATDLGVAIDFCSSPFLLLRIASLPVAYSHSLLRGFSHGLIIVMQEGGFPSMQYLGTGSRKKNQTNIKYTHGHIDGGMFHSENHEWERMDLITWAGAKLVASATSVIPASFSQETEGPSV